MPDRTGHVSQVQTAPDRRGVWSNRARRTLWLATPLLHPFKAENPKQTCRLVTRKDSLVPASASFLAKWGVGLFEMRHAEKSLPITASLCGLHFSPGQANCNRPVTIKGRSTDD